MCMYSIYVYSIYAHQTKRSFDVRKLVTRKSGLFEIPAEESLRIVLEKNSNVCVLQTGPGMPTWPGAATVPGAVPNLQRALQCQKAFRKREREDNGI